MNPLINIPPTMNQAQNPLLQSLSSMIKFAQSFSSPQAFLQTMQRENPSMYQNLMQLSQQIQNPMATATQMLSQNGITPQQIQAMFQR